MADILNQAQTRTLELKCHCGSVHMTFDIPRVEFPLFAYTCQCSTCRFVTGAPCIFHSQLTPGLGPKFIAPSSPANLKSYLPEGNLYCFDHCSTCGCHVAALTADRKQWLPSLSMLSETGPAIFEIKIRAFSKSVVDLGIAQYTPRIGGRDVPEYNMPEGHRQSRLVVADPEFGEDGTDRLRVQCVCAGVSFTVKRPSREVVEDSFLSAWVDPENQTRWLAEFELSDESRLVSGTHVNGWMFATPSSCEPAIPPDLKIGTIKTYSPSPGALNGFCGDCGASVFFSRDDERVSEDKLVLRIAGGVIRAPEGYLARKWMAWRREVSGMSEGKAYDKEFAEALEEGFQAYKS